jgi:hypothetical protein
MRPCRPGLAQTIPCLARRTDQPPRYVIFQSAGPIYTPSPQSRRAGAAGVAGVAPRPKGDGVVAAAPNKAAGG